MPNIQLVVSDMDDTLAPHMQNVISEPVRDAVIAVENQGVKVAVVTGRAFEHALGALNLLGVEGPCVFDGGATIADPKTGKIIWKCWIDVETTKQIIAIIKNYCFEAYFSLSHEMQKLDQVDAGLIKEEAPAVFALAQNKELATKAIKSIDTIRGVAAFTGLGTHPDTGEWFPYIQITHYQANKFHGVEALREILEISKEHTLAIGDGDNDVPLFQNAKFRIAMGNATEDLKRHADYTVGTLEQDGFAEAMKRFVLA
jgi:Cof subfamily protein (haloacid dehalogenase superfamily)